MSRTYRNIEYAGWFARPKTQNHRRQLHKTKQEIKEELGVNYLAGNSKDYKSVPTGWDDLHISAHEEVLEYSLYIERMYEHKVIEIYKEVPFWLKINFNTHKNRIEIAIRSYFNRLVLPKAMYIPFCLNHKKYKYPTILLEHDMYY